MSEYPEDVAGYDFAGAGYQPHRDDGFLGLVGSDWQKVDEDGVTVASQATKRHANLRGVVHGGMLMTLADRRLGMLGRTQKAIVLRRRCGSISTSSHRPVSESS